MARGHTECRQLRVRARSLPPAEDLTLGAIGGGSQERGTELPSSLPPPKYGRAEGTD